MGGHNNVLAADVRHALGTAWNFGHVISYFSCSLAVAVMNLVSDGVCRRWRERET